MSEPSDPNTSAAGWRNWAGDQRCTPRAIERPASIEEVAAAVERAREEGSRVRVAGAGHSFSDIACSDGAILKLERLAGVSDVDRSSGLVGAHAGVTIRERSSLLPSPRPR